MILNPLTRRDAGESAVVAQITAEVQACGAPSAALDAGTVAEVARAVELFLTQQVDGEFVDSKTLSLLASQALMSLGEDRAARSLLLFGSGMVRPASWEVSGERDMWILDLREMTVRSDAALEMVFFRGLAMVLDSTADIWDEKKGVGVLGLRHVCSAAQALLGGERSGGLVSEIVALCCRKLDLLRDQRGWHSRPEVLNLDL